MLRLDWNLLFNMINLLILYALMKRFLFKPVRVILEQRQKEADAQFAKAGQKQDEADQMKAKYDALVQGAEQEREQLLADARSGASQEYSRIVAEAKEEADEIVTRARTDAETEKDAVLQQAEEQVRDMVVTAAAKIAAKKNSEAGDRELYDKFLAEAE